MEILHITKRNFSQKPFELSKITNAILKAMKAVNHGEATGLRQLMIALQEKIGIGNTILI